MIKKILGAIAISLTLFSFQAVPVRAAVGPLLDPALIREVSCQDEQGRALKQCNYSVNSFVKLGLSLVRIILGVVGALTLAMFVYGGFMMLIAAGNTETVGTGKKIIGRAVIGLAIVFSSYAAVNFLINTVFQAKVNGEPAFNGGVPADTPNSGTSATGITDCTGAVAAGGKGGTCVPSGQCGNGSVTGGTKECGGDKVCCVPPKSCTASGGYSCVRGTSCGAGRFRISDLYCPTQGDICCSGVTQVTCQMAGSSFGCYSGSTCPLGTQAASNYPCNTGQVCCMATNLNINNN